jgi:hypothetical protein
MNKGGSVIKNPRVYFAMSFLAAGVVFAPLVRTSTDAIDWRALAQAYQDLIFSDGFDDGTTDNWTTTIAGKTVTLVLPKGSPTALDIVRSVDSFGRAWVPTAILLEQGYDGRGFNAGPNTLVEDCEVKIDESGVIVINFLMPTSP